MVHRTRNTSQEAGALVLLYHRVIDLPNDPQLLSVSPRHFDEHLEVLRRRYHPVSLPELIAAIREKRIPDRCIVLTFDDGYVDNLKIAKPILEKYEIPATVLVTARGAENVHEFWWDELEKLLLHDQPLPQSLELTIQHHCHQWRLERINTQPTHDPHWNVLSARPPTPRQALYLFLCHLLRPLDEVRRSDLLAELAQWRGMTREARPTHRCMDEAQLCELGQSSLIDIGAHTITHPVLTMCSPQEQLAEIAGSRHRLEAILNRDVNTFSYPFGTNRDYSEKTVSIVRESGFTAACANKGRGPGASCVIGSDANLHTLPRIIAPDANGDQLDSLLQSCWKEAKAPRTSQVLAPSHL